MNQIPNIEEWKKIARERLAPNVTYIDPKFKEVASWAEKLLNAFWVEQQKDLDAFIDTIHHQLQKAQTEKFVDGIIAATQWLIDNKHLKAGKELNEMMLKSLTHHSELDQDKK